MSIVFSFCWRLYPFPYMNFVRRMCSCVMDRHNFNKNILYILKIPTNQKICFARAITRSIFLAVFQLALYRSVSHTNDGTNINYLPCTEVVGNGWMDRSLRLYHFFLCSSIETPPGPRETIMSSPPITDNVWKKSYFKKSRRGLYVGMDHHALW